MSDIRLCFGCGCQISLKNDVWASKQRGSKRAYVCHRCLKDDRYKDFILFGREPEQPYFVKIGGCINCETRTEHKKKFGTDYGCFDHELMIACFLNGCDAYGYSIARPFIHPDEIMVLARKDGRPEMIRKGEEIAARLRKRFDIPIVIQNPD